MYLQSLATAFPEHEYSQQECLRILSSSAAMEAIKPRSRQILEKVLTGDSGIETRRLSPTRIVDVLRENAGGLHRVFEEHAPRLATQALQKSCDAAGVKPSEIDALLICTCTGYLCPGLSSHVSEILGMRPDAFLQDLLGLGCGAAIPMLEAARGIAAARPGSLIATVAVEISSAAFYVDDDPGVLISLCLFGEQAAAAPEVAVVAVVPVVVGGEAASVRSQDEFAALVARKSASGAWPTVINPRSLARTIAANSAPLGSSKLITAVPSGGKTRVKRPALAAK